MTDFKPTMISSGSTKAMKTRDKRERGNSTYKFRFYQRLVDCRPKMDSCQALKALSWSWAPKSGAQGSTCWEFSSEDCLALSLWGFAPRALCRLWMLSWARQGFQRCYNCHHGVDLTHHLCQFRGSHDSFLFSQSSSLAPSWKTCGFEAQSRSHRVDREVKPCRSCCS